MPLPDLFNAPGTTEQLPKSAADYYRDSVAPGLLTSEYIGRDECGRKVYQRHTIGSGSAMRALLTYGEYVRLVKSAATRSSSMGVQRWTSPTGRVRL